MDEYKKIDFHCLLTHQNDKAKKKRPRIDQIEIELNWIDQR